MQSWLALRRARRSPSHGALSLLGTTEHAVQATAPLDFPRTLPPNWRVAILPAVKSTVGDGAGVSTVFGGLSAPPIISGRQAAIFTNECTARTHSCSLRSRQRLTGRPPTDTHVRLCMHAPLGERRRWTRWAPRGGCEGCPPQLPLTTANQSSPRLAQSGKLLEAGPNQGSPPITVNALFLRAELPEDDVTMYLDQH